MPTQRLVYWPGAFLGAGFAMLAILLPGPCVAAEKGKITVEKVEYKGWKNNLRLSNGDVELIVTLDVGPRIISYRLAGGPNVFKEFPEQMGKSGETEWQIRGGHRLWAGPEDLTRTYALDNAPVQWTGPTKLEDGSQGWEFTPSPDKEYGIQKKMIVRLMPRGSKVTVVHLIQNVGDKPTELAVWGLSAMAAGGVEIIPLPPKKPHPGPPKNARSPEDFASNQLMVLWPFFDFRDPRWNFGSRFITLHQDSNRGPTKIGLAHRLGGVGYWNQGTLFVKRFVYQQGENYPDHGCNFETFTNKEFVEIETLGPLVSLEPGKSATTAENWELFQDIPEFKDEAGIEKDVLPKLKTD